MLLKTLNTHLSKLFLLLSLCATSSCSPAKWNDFDHNSSLKRSEIEDSLIRNKDHKKDKKETKNKKTKKTGVSLPKFSNLIISPPPPVIGGEKIISFSTTAQVPLKDILIELGRLAKIDIDIDSEISGGVILNAKNRPLKEVIDRIASLGNLRYSYKNGVLFFERDTPYLKNYFVDYLVAGSLWTDVESNISAILASKQTPNQTSSSTSNKSAGIISLFATQQQHKLVDDYLKIVSKHASAQVLIEAKVVEVTLGKDFASGIDWSWKNKLNTAGDISSGFTVGGLSFGAGSSTTSAIDAIQSTGNLGVAIKALERFGTTKAISSPRIAAMNNQTATLDFSENFIYFTLEASASTVGGGAGAATTIAVVTATKNEVPIGVKLVITPSINVETSEITLDIKPTLSVRSGEVDDPSVNPSSPTGESLNNKVPLIKTRSLETLAKVQSGNILVIGGLMSDTTSDEEIGVPFLSRIPVLGYLFKYSSKTTEIIETVIFIKATIANSDDVAGKEDRELQQNFDTNKRIFF